jgi:hypothetical protein
MSDDICAEIQFSDGTLRKQEFYQGSSFLSQSAGFLSPGSNVKSVTFTNSIGKKRKLDF